MFVEVIADLTGFISYYPLKQGLKPGDLPVGTIVRYHLYPTIH